MSNVNDGSYESPITVQSDDWGVRTFRDGNEHGQIAWAQVEIVFVNIEDEFLPFPYWYIGNAEGSCIVRIPNDAGGAESLFFDVFPERLDGYRCDETYEIIAAASSALAGTFVVWKSSEIELPEPFKAAERIPGRHHEGAPRNKRNWLANIFAWIIKPFQFWRRSARDKESRVDK